MNASKKDFLLGLTAGIAAISFFGFAVMTVAYFQKGNINNTEKEVKSGNTKTAEKPIAKTNDQNNNNTAPADVKVTSADYIRGDKDAPITIVEFSDFQCPFCARFHETMQQVMKDYKGKVRWVYRHFPLESIHPYARKAAEASECAGEQNKFWEYADQLIENQSSLNADYLKELAGTLSLDVKKFSSCLDSGKFSKKVDNDLAEGQKLGVKGTPASFINGKLVSGALPYEQIKSTIDSIK